MEFQGIIQSLYQNLITNGKWTAFVADGQKIPADQTLEVTEQAWLVSTSNMLAAIGGGGIFYSLPHPLYNYLKRHKSCWGCNRDPDQRYHQALANANDNTKPQKKPAPSAPTTTNRPPAKKQAEAGYRMSPERENRLKQYGIFQFTGEGSPKSPNHLLSTTAFKGKRLCSFYTTKKFFCKKPDDGGCQFAHVQQLDHLNDEDKTALKHWIADQQDYKFAQNRGPNNTGTK